MSAQFSPDHVLDRTDEQNAFAALLGFESEMRVMTIRDRGQAGKSELLALLRWRCAEGDLKVPVCLVALDQLQPQSPYVFVRRVEQTMRANGLNFPGFRKMENARLDRAMINVNIDVGEMKDDAKLTGIAGDVILNSAGDVDEILQDRAVEAFIHDLRAAYSASPMVLLLDAYERCNEELAQWIRGFLSREVLAPGAALQRLVVVIAGREVPVDQLRAMLQDRFERVVRPFPSLSVWDREHVRALIVMKGVTPTDTDVEFFHEKLRETNLSIGRAIELLDLYADQNIES